MRIDQFEEDITSNTASLDDSQSQEQDQADSEEVIVDEAPEMEAAELATEVDEDNQTPKKKNSKANALNVDPESIPAEEQNAKKSMQEQS